MTPGREVPHGLKPILRPFAPFRCLHPSHPVGLRPAAYSLSYLESRISNLVNRALWTAGFCQWRGMPGEQPLTSAVPPAMMFFSETPPAKL